MLRISRPLRRSGETAWFACLDCEQGGEWIRLYLRAEDGSSCAASDLAFGRCALAIAGALLAELADRDSSIADAAELVARALAGDVDAVASIEEIQTDAETNPQAEQALADLDDAAAARELLDRASAGDADALELLGQIAEDADAGDENAIRAERALCAPALVGTPTLDLGCIELRDGPPAAVARLRRAFQPLSLMHRGATVAMRAIGRGGLATGAA